MAGKRVTIVDVGRAAGVSPSTVSLVLREHPSISALTVSRVRAAMEDLGYVYNRGAAALRQTNTRMIGTVVHDLANDTMTEIALGANVAARELGYVQLLGHTGDDLAAQRDTIRGLREYGLRGLILSPAHGTRAADLAEMTVVQVGRQLPGNGLSSVTSDNARGVDDAMDYLAALGHRRVAFLGGRSDTETFRQRSAAFREALARLGMAKGPVIQAEPTLEGGIGAIRTLLAGGAEPPTAVMCFNDVVAFGVYQGLRGAGLEPARDVSVVGFDDVASSRVLQPTLTTVSIHAREMGASAARLLVALLTGVQKSPVHELAPVQLQVRDSCLPPRAGAR